MNLGGIVGQVLPLLREVAESLMLDTCTVQAVTGVTTNVTTGVDTPVYATPAVYTGKCKIAGDRPYESNPEVGGSTATIQRVLFHVPADAGPFEAGHVVTVTASALQPHLVGQQFRIAGPDERSTQTAQRIYVDRVS